MSLNYVVVKITTLINMILITLFDGAKHVVFFVHLL